MLGSRPTSPPSCPVATAPRSHCPRLALPFGFGDGEAIAIPLTDALTHVPSLRSRPVATTLDSSPFTHGLRRWQSHIVAIVMALTIGKLCILAATHTCSITSRGTRLALRLALGLLLVHVCLHHSHDHARLARVRLENPAAAVAQTGASREDSTGGEGQRRGAGRLTRSSIPGLRARARSRG